MIRNFHQKNLIKKFSSSIQRKYYEPVLIGIPLLTTCAIIYKTNKDFETIIQNNTRQSDEIRNFIKWKFDQEELLSDKYKEQYEWIREELRKERNDSSEKISSLFKILKEHKIDFDLDPQIWGPSDISYMT